MIRVGVLSETSSLRLFRREEPLLAFSDLEQPPFGTPVIPWHNIILQVKSIVHATCTRGNNMLLNHALPAGLCFHATPHELAQADSMQAGVPFRGKVKLRYQRGSFMG